VERLSRKNIASQYKGVLRQGVMSVQGTHAAQCMGLWRGFRVLGEGDSLGVGCPVGLEESGIEGTHILLLACLGEIQVGEDQAVKVALQCAIIRSGFRHQQKVGGPNKCTFFSLCWCKAIGNSALILFEISEYVYL
jgi:hypothetical protein